MVAVAAAIVMLLVASPSISAQSDTCFDYYLCKWEVQTTTGVTLGFDLSPLCNGGDYTVNDTFGHTFSFNICGHTRQECHPTWTPIKTTGVAIQSWGSAPPCNQL